VTTILQTVQKGKYYISQKACPKAEHGKREKKKKESNREVEQIFEQGLNLSGS
jgi:hypothetical protein